MLLTPPRIIVTGLSHSGLRALSAMLTAGGALHHVAADPHLPPFPVPEVKTIGLWLERAPRDMARSKLRHQGTANPWDGELRSLAIRTGQIYWHARDAAVKCYAPVFVFRFEDMISDPEAQAKRLANLFSGAALSDLGPPACPLFDARAAALAIRRIAPPPPKGHPLRLIRTLGNA